MVTGATATRNDGWLGRLLWGENTNTGLTGCGKAKKSEEAKGTTPYELSLPGVGFAGALGDNWLSHVCSDEKFSKDIAMLFAKKLLEKDPKFSTLNSFQQRVAVAILGKKLHEANAEKPLIELTEAKAMCMSKNMGYFWQVGGLADRVWLGVMSNAVTDAISFVQTPSNIVKIEGPEPFALIANEEVRITVTISVLDNPDLEYVTLPPTDGNAYSFEAEYPTVGLTDLAMSRSEDKRTVIINATASASENDLTDVANDIKVYLDSPTGCPTELGRLEGAITGVVEQPIVEPEPEEEPEPIVPVARPPRVIRSEPAHTKPIAPPPVVEERREEPAPARVVVEERREEPAPARVVVEERREEPPPPPKEEPKFCDLNPDDPMCNF